MSVGSKTIIPVFKMFSPDLLNEVMASTDTLTSPPTNITYKDSFAIQLQWTGTPTGVFEVQGSIDYVPVSMQANSWGPPNPGTWTKIDLFDAFGNPPEALGTDGQILINMNQLAFPYIRIVYTNASGNGVLNGFIAGKSLG